MEPFMQALSSKMDGQYLHSQVEQAQWDVVKGKVEDVQFGERRLVWRTGTTS